MTTTKTRPAILGGPRAVTLEVPQRWPVVTDEIVEAVVDHLRVGSLSIVDRSGPIAGLEDDFAGRYERRFAVSFCNGTSALEAAYYAIGLGPGDEVVAPSYTFWATVMPMLPLGAVPVFAEVDPHALTLNPADVERRLTSRTRAIVVNHSWGRTADLSALQNIASRHGLALVEDCSHAHGATYNGRPIGSQSTVSCFSLQANKPVAAGEGGMLLTNDATLLERAVLYGHSSARARADVRSETYAQFAEAGLGHKMRIHPLAATIGRVFMRHLDELIQIRRTNMGALSESLNDLPALEPPCAPAGGDHTFYRYKLLYDETSAGLSASGFVAAMRAEGVPLLRAEEPLLHLLPIFRPSEDRRFLGAPFDAAAYRARVAYARGDLPTTEAMYERVLRLDPLVAPAPGVVEQFSVAFHKVLTHAAEIARLQSAAVTSA